MTATNLLMALFGCSSDQQLVRIVEDPVIPKPEDVRDEFEQNSDVAKIDALFVVDDSGSMGGSQGSLAANLPYFTENFMATSLDYHMGVITTDMANTTKQGRLQEAYGFKYVDTTTQSQIDATGMTDDYGYPLTTEAVFNAMAMPGIYGSGTEKGRDAVHYSLNYYQGTDALGQPDDSNVGFVRSDAALHVVLVSDEDDFSTEITPDDFKSELVAMQTAGKTVQFHSIVGFEGDSCSYDPGTAYMDVSAVVGGQIYSICAPNWDTMLESIGLSASGLDREFVLSKIPMEETIEVEVNYEDPIGSGNIETYYPDVGDNEHSEIEYRSETNSLWFLNSEDIPPFGAEIHVEYQTYPGWNE